MLNHRQSLLVALVALIALLAGALEGPAAVLPVSGARLWLETENGEGVAYQSSGGMVDVWLDQSGTGINMNVLSGHTARRPALTAPLAALNNHAALSFDGANDYLRNGLTRVFTGGDATVFAVYRASSPATNAFIYDTEPDNGLGRRSLQFHQDNHTSFSRDGVGGGAINTAVRPAGSYLRFTGVIDGAGSFTRINGANQVNGNISDAVVTCGDIAIGARFSIDSAFYNGNIAELIVYERVLNGTELASVESYLSQKYSSAAPLPHDLSTWVGVNNTAGNNRIFNTATTAGGIFQERTISGGSLADTSLAGGPFGFNTSLSLTGTVRFDEPGADRDPNWFFGWYDSTDPAGRRLGIAPADTGSANNLRWVIAASGSGGAQFAALSSAGNTAIPDGTYPVSFSYNPATQQVAASIGGFTNTLNVLSTNAGVFDRFGYLLPSGASVTSTLLAQFDDITYTGGTPPAILPLADLSDWVAANTTAGNNRLDVTQTTAGGTFQERFSPGPAFLADATLQGGPVGYDDVLSASGKIEVDEPGAERDPNWFFGWYNSADPLNQRLAIGPADNGAADNMRWVAIAAGNGGPTVYGIIDASVPDGMTDFFLGYNPVTKAVTATIDGTTINFNVAHTNVNAFDRFGFFMPTGTNDADTLFAKVIGIDYTGATLLLVPEPASMGLLLLGAAALLGFRRRR